MPAYVIYARKSSEDEDRQILSIPAQIAELRALAGARGIAVVEVFEESQSARRPGRPLFARMLDVIERGHASGILCWKPDRLARNMIDGGRIIDALDRGRLDEIVGPGSVFKNTSNDKFMLGLAFTMSKKYVDDLSDNVRRGNRAVAQSGRATAGVPIGYLKTPPLDRTRGRGAGRTIIDAERFPLIRELFTRFLTGAWTGAALHGFAENELNLRTRGTRRYPSRPLCITAIYAMLRNPFYAGFLRHGGEVFRGEHEAMISDADFRRVQMLLGRRDAPRPSRTTFSYAGLLHCGDCGRAVVGEEHWNRRYGYRYVYYRCTRRRVGYIRCPEHPVREPDVTEQIETALDRLHIPQWVLEWTWAQLDHASSEMRAVAAAAIAGVRAELATKESELERLTQLCARGVLPEAEYIRSRTRVSAELEALRSRVVDPERAAADADQTLRRVLTLAADPGRAFREGDETERRELLGNLSSRITVKDRGVAIEFRRPYNVLKGSWAAPGRPDDANHPLARRISRNQAPNRPGRNAEVHAGESVRITRDANHVNAQSPQQKTAAGEAAISRWWAWMESNHRPLHYQCNALTN